MSFPSLFGKPKKHHSSEGKLCIVLERNDVDLFLDVGANVGQTGTALRLWGYRGRILSFEPVSACHERLRAAAMGDSAWQVMDRMALGDRDGAADILISEADDLSSLAAPTAALKKALPRAMLAQRETVPLARLDTFFKDGLNARRPFLKIDAQGHDFAVLNGAEGIMPSLWGIQVEMSLLPLYEGETLYREILNFLHERGFRPHLITDRTFSRRLGRQLQIDGVFFRE